MPSKVQQLFISVAFGAISQPDVETPSNWTDWALCQRLIFYWIFTLLKVDQTVYWKLDQNCYV